VRRERIADRLGSQRRGRPRAVLAASCSHRGPRPQLGQPQEIEGRAGEDEEPCDLRQAAEFDLAKPGDGLQPAKGRFDARSAGLADGIPGVSRGAGVNRAATPALHVLRHVGRNPQLATDVHEGVRIVILVRADRPSGRGRRRCKRADDGQVRPALPDGRRRRCARPPSRAAPVAQRNGLSCQREASLLLSRNVRGIVVSTSLPKLNCSTSSRRFESHVF
jgi:hypothetical protein